MSGHKVGQSDIPLRTGILHISEHPTLKIGTSDSSEPNQSSGNLHISDSPTLKSEYPICVFSQHSNLRKRFGHPTLPFLLNREPVSLTLTGASDLPNLHRSLRHRRRSHLRPSLDDSRRPTASPPPDWRRRTSSAELGQGRIP